MPEFPDTRESLIVGVRDPSNRTAWEEFEQIYRPVIFRIARAKGLQHADALDLVQQVLVSVAAAIDRFEKRDDDVKFRNWLSRVTRNTILKALERAPRDRGVGGSDMLDVLSEVPAEQLNADALIDIEYRRELFRRAAEQVRNGVKESTWLAFELTVLQNISIQRAAETLGVPTGNVYASRSRVMRRIRIAVTKMQKQDGGDPSSYEPE